MVHGLADCLPKKMKKTAAERRRKKAFFSFTFIGLHFCRSKQEERFANSISKVISFSTSGTHDSHLSAVQWLLWQKEKKKERRRDLMWFRGLHTNCRFPSHLFFFEVFFGLTSPFFLSSYYIQGLVLVAKRETKASQSMLRDFQSWINECVFQ